MLLDYAHNAHAVEQICQLVGRLDVGGRRIGVLSAPGDRRDEDIRAVARIAAGTFDHYICRRDDVLRGRESDEVPLMLRDTLIAEGVPRERIDVIPDEERAVHTALDMAGEGDLVVLLGDSLTRTWKQIVQFESKGTRAEAAPAASAVRGLPELPRFELDQEQPLVRDERGVRLAREEDD